MRKGFARFMICLCSVVVLASCVPAGKADKEGSALKRDDAHAPVDKNRESREPGSTKEAIEKIKGIVNQTKALAEPPLDTISLTVLEPVSKPSVFRAPAETVKGIESKKGLGYQPMVSYFCRAGNNWLVFQNHIAQGNDNFYAYNLKSGKKSATIRKIVELENGKLYGVCLDNGDGEAKTVPNWHLLSENGLLPVGGKLFSDDRLWELHWFKSGHRLLFVDGKSISFTNLDMSRLLSVTKLQGATADDQLDNACIVGNWLVTLWVNKDTDIVTFRRYDIETGELAWQASNRLSVCYRFYSMSFKGLGEVGLGLGGNFLTNENGILTVYLYFHDLHPWIEETWKMSLEDGKIISREREGSIGYDIYSGKDARIFGDFTIVENNFRVSVRNTIDGREIFNIKAPWKSIISISSIEHGVLILRESDKGILTAFKMDGSILWERDVGPFEGVAYGEKTWLLFKSQLDPIDDWTYRYYLFDPVANKPVKTVLTEKYSMPGIRGPGRYKMIYMGPEYPFRDRQSNDLSWVYDFELLKPVLAFNGWGEILHDRYVLMGEFGKNTNYTGLYDISLGKFLWKIDLFCPVDKFAENFSNKPNKLYLERYVFFESSHGLVMLDIMTGKVGNIKNKIELGDPSGDVLAIETNGIELFLEGRDNMYILDMGKVDGLIKDMEASS